MSSDNLQPDRLTQGLPVELFTKIVELAQAHPQCAYLGLVSRAFLPLARHHRFRKTTIHSYDKLESLCTLSQTHEFVHSIKELTIDFEGVKDPGTPKKADFHALLKRLYHVETFKVKASGRLAKEILDPKSNLRASKPPLGTIPLPAMQALEIDDPFQGWANPFDPRHYSSLKHYRSLDSLSLKIVRAPDSIGRYRSAPVSQLSAARGFAWSVALTGYLADQPAVRDLLHAFDEIAILDLIDLGTAEGDVFGPLLSSIRYLDVLKVLDLQRSHRPPTLLPALGHLPVLKSVLFRVGANPSDADLRCLLEGPDKPPKLEFVGINCAEILMYNEWEGIVTCPWSTTCTYAGTLKNMELAERVGIDLGGSLITYAKDERWFYEAVGRGEILLYDEEDWW
ncbi:hypothetical protein BMF94_0999 [Rhodotorula taiwanensis]|uniref:F-box domain-containing protein n=1 Tax=Rhodotorula taiwanensis TaxID=741276 RepID=A0A2S5BGL8_9BASI|nr:hypothetical protein BMF94_0999 [Rhodotorula taiwanensis]